MCYTRKNGIWEKYENYKTSEGKIKQVREIFLEEVRFHLAS